MHICRYGQMTAGSYCYIGPQGIVHGTTVGWLMLLQCSNSHSSTVVFETSLLC